MLYAPLRECSKIHWQSLYVLNKVSGTKSHSLKHAFIFIPLVLNFHTVCQHIVSTLRVTQPKEIYWLKLRTMSIRDILAGIPLTIASLFCCLVYSFKKPCKLQSWIELIIWVFAGIFQLTCKAGENHTRVEMRAHAESWSPAPCGSLVPPNNPLCPSRCDFPVPSAAISKLWLQCPNILPYHLPLTNSFISYIISFSLHHYNFFFLSLFIYFERE